MRRLNHGLDPGGTSDRRAHAIRHRRGGESRRAADLERELERFRWKVEAGAEFAVTQPVFDPAELDRFLERIAPLPDSRSIAGIWPLISLRNAEFLANEVPGVRVPEGVLERMRQRREPAARSGARRRDLRIAREVLEAVRGLVQGVQVSTPGGRIEVALETLGQLTGQCYRAARRPSGSATSGRSNPRLLT